MRAKDFLDELIAERTAKNPGFGKLVEEAAQRRAMAQKLAKRRQAQHLSQTQVAARMATSPSVVSKLESGGDVKVSTLQRYCAAINEPFPFAATPSHRSQARAG